jgi:hypothetical protein
MPRKEALRIVPGPYRPSLPPGCCLRILKLPRRRARLPTFILIIALTLAEVCSDAPHHLGHAVLLRWPAQPHGCRGLMSTLLLPSRFSRTRAERARWEPGYAVERARGIVGRTILVWVSSSLTV